MSNNHKKNNKVKMKTIYLNIQSKGGAGKSMLTYLQALKNEENEGTAFVDLDKSTKTTAKQLRFLGGKSIERVFEIDLFDSHKRIEREKLFKIFEALNETNFSDIYVDFGAPESEQLPSLLSMDFSIEDFKEFETGLDAKIVFNVIIAGGPAFASCFEYLKLITGIVKGKFEVIALPNEFTFQNYPSQIEELKDFVAATKGLVKEVKPFGDIQVDRESGRIITDNVKEGLGLSHFNSFAVKLIIRKELAKI